MDSYSKEKLFKENSALDLYTSLPGFTDQNYTYDTSLHFRPLFGIKHKCLNNDIFKENRIPKPFTDNSNQT